MKPPEIRSSLMCKSKDSLSLFVKPIKRACLYCAANPIDIHEKRLTDVL